MNLFDCICTVGRGLKTTDKDPCTVQDLLDDMDRVGVSEALVLDALSCEHHPTPGNARILESVQDHPRLHPAWTFLPHAPEDEQVGPRELIREMQQEEVGVLFLFPRQYGFELNDWTVDEYVEPLASEEVPIFVSYNTSRDRGMDACRWGELVAFCQRWPSLPVVLVEHRIRRKNRVLYRAFDACQNLHLCLSSYWLHHGIEYIARNWGAERLIFGSNWPHLNQDCTAATLAMADISDEEKSLIAGENLRQLLGWGNIDQPDVALPEPADEYDRFARTGDRPEGMHFLDCHGHIEPYSPNYHIPDGSLAETVNEMDRLGVDKSCVFSLSVAHSDERPGNDIVARAVSEYPDRFVGFVGINPHRGKEVVQAELHPSSFIADGAVDFFRRRHHDEPCFMHVSFVDPHHPWDPPAEIADHYPPEDMPLPDFRECPLEWPASLRERSGDFSDISDEHTRAVIAYYYGMIEMVDRAVGEVVEAIEEAGELENTVFMFTADHGELLGDYGLFRKGSYHFDSMIRTPCFLSAPGRLPAGRRVDGLVESIDLAPTVLSLAGIEPYEGMQGNDMASALGSGEDIGKEHVYCEMYTAWWGPFVACWTLRTEEAKLNYYPQDEQGHLFDLNNDPDEINNLWDSVEHRGMRGRMMALLLRAQHEQSDPLPRVLSQY